MSHHDTTTHTTTTHTTGVAPVVTSAGPSVTNDHGHVVDTTLPGAHAHYGGTGDPSRTHREQKGAKAGHGAKEAIGGALKAGIGKVFGDHEMVEEGIAQKEAGKVEQEMAKADKGKGTMSPEQLAALAQSSAVHEANAQSMLAGKDTHAKFGDGVQKGVALEQHAAGIAGPAPTGTVEKGHLVETHPVGGHHAAVPVHGAHAAHGHPVAATHATHADTHAHGHPVAATGAHGHPVAVTHGHTNPATLPPGTAGVDAHGLPIDAAGRPVVTPHTGL